MDKVTLSIEEVGRVNIWAESILGKGNNKSKDSEAEIYIFV